jgi:2-amino-4-hydroxy-6-hydroxymethyldihydropteridine diphosphokinase
LARAFIGMGSNIDPERNMREALRLLASAVRVLDLSTVHQTEPIGRPEQPPFYNCVAAVETQLSPQELKQTVLRAIEHRLGRVRSGDKYAARTIDLDLLLYGELVLREAGLELPDPDILVRPFLACGLHELAPGLVLPGSSLPISEVAGRLKDPAMKPLETYTALLKGELRHGP